MSKESLERFMEKVGNDDELRVSIESQLDSDGNISVDALIALGTENGCEFSAEDLTENAELSDEELDNVAGGVWEGGGGFNRRRDVLSLIRSHVTPTRDDGSANITIADPSGHSGE